MNIRSLSVGVLLCATWLFPSNSDAITFTNDTTIGILNTNYDGSAVVISNCTVTINGPHTFSTLLVADGGKLTHTSNGSGQTIDVFSITNESQTLADTNAVSLLNPNVVLATVAVADVSSTILYTNNVDYTLSAAGNGFTQLARTTNSAIPDGTNVLVSYNWQSGSVASGVNLVVSGDAFIMAGGLIDAVGCGYSSANTTGRGGSAGNPQDGAGGGNGGTGGISSSNAVGGVSFVGTYWPASSLGGAGGTGAGGVGASGGGLVKIQCGGTFTLNGTINVGALTATNARSGGGAGGSVWIATTNFTGAGGIMANGGAGEPVHGGGGGGGRIAIEFATNTFDGSLTAVGGAGWQVGGAGTVFVRQFGTVGQLTFDNGGVAGASTFLSSTSGPNLTVQGKASAAFTGVSSTLGEVLVRSNSSILPISTNNPTFSLLTVQSNATIEATAKMTSNGRGFTANGGNGAPSQSSAFVGAGAGHGGLGGDGSLGPGTNAVGGQSYDSISGPNTMGSGGRSLALAIGGTGGGAIYLNVLQNLRVDGEISANATAGTGDRSGGGSGGTLAITAGSLSGTGLICADGGTGGLPYGGGGAGGRIAISYTNNNFTGVFSAHGGNGSRAGGAGTIYLKPVAQSAGDLFVDNGGFRGANTLRDSIPIANLTVMNGAVLSNSVASDSFNNVVVGTNATLFFAYATPTVSITSNVTVAAGGTILVDGTSLISSTPGSGGGGHGGAGGAGISSSGGLFTSDPASSPALTGGAGGYGPATVGGFSARGGGALTMTISGTLFLNGKISANGLDGVTNGAGGGAGGSLRLTVGGLSGAGVFAADGGSGFLPNGGGGGGGRIAVTCNATGNSFTGTFSAKGGNGYQRGGAGTVFYKKDLRSVYPSVVVDNGGFVGTNTSVFVSGFNAIDLTVQGGGLISFWGGPSLANLLIRSNSWLAVGGFYTVISNATFEAGGGIRLDGVGTSTLGAGLSTTRGGAGHGGFGGGNFFVGASGGNVYDQIATPTLDGSAGGGLTSGKPPVGGTGGDAMQLTVQGVLQVDGRISSDGLSGDLGSGGGSGGSLWLILNQFKGNGVISANGGNGVPSAGLGGGGGGGRIAITWNPAVVSNKFTTLFAGTITARGGNGAASGGAGTVYLKRNDQSFSTVIVDNGGLMASTNTPLTSPGANWNLSILGGATVYPNTTLTGISNLLIGAGSQLTAPPSFSLLLAVSDKATVEAGGSINVDGKGYARANGVTGGAGASVSSKGAGGGYGGAGGASSSNAKGGTNYGSATQPVNFGSGGGAGANTYVSGCEGGGALNLIVPGTLTLEGSLSANGNAGLQDDSGGGAGGSIWVTAKSITGAGVIAADGGDGELYGGGGGGGGRIAIYAKTTNTFTGLFSALGGDGANAGQNGSIIFTTNMVPFSIVSASPSGVTSNTVGSITFNFNQLVGAATVSLSQFTLAMPSNYVGSLPSLTTGVGGAAVTLNASPAINVPGDYTVVVTPTITDVFGTPLSLAYTNAFTVAIPTVEGSVQDINGLGISGVTVQTPGYLPTSTDATGNYILGVPPGWSGTIIPSLGPNMFVPGSIALANVTTQTTNQNFVMVPTILPDVTSSASGTNLLFNWTGFSSVTYQAYTSSNLVDWVPWGSPLPGTNAPMQLQIPVGTDADSFFRLGALN